MTQKLQNKATIKTVMPQGKNRGSRAQSAQSGRAPEPAWWASAGAKKPERKPQAPRSTAEQMRQRIEAVAGMLRRAWSRSRIIQFGAENWGVCERQIDEYMERSRAAIQERADKNRDRYLAETIEYAREAVEVARDQGSVSCMLAAQQWLAKLIGMDKLPFQRTEISGPSGEPTCMLVMPEKGGSITQEEFERREAEIAASQENSNGVQD